MNQEDDAVEMFLIAVVITRVFCYWKAQQLITFLLFALLQFALGLVNDFGYSYLNVPEDAL